MLYLFDQVSVDKQNVSQQYGTDDLQPQQHKQYIIHSISSTFAKK